MNEERLAAKESASLLISKDALKHYLTRLVTPAYSPRGLLARIACDLAMANIAFFLGFIFSILYNAVIKNSDEVSSLWVCRMLLSGWLVQAPLFTLVALVSFAAGGMYGVSPRCRIRQKLSVSLVSVLFAYLLYVALVYLLNSVARAVLPASAVIAALGLSFVLVPGPRLAKKLVSRAYILEPRLNPKRKRVESVLIIGGAGYIGSVLARQLLDAGYQVRILDELLFGAEPIRELHGHPNFELIVGDFRHIENVARAVRGMDAVIHLGAIVGDPACALDSGFTLSVNTHAVRMIRDLCCGYGVQRFLFASTCSVYGAQDGIIDEHSPLAPVSLYAQSKIEAEQVLLEKTGDRFHPTILRLATAFGLSRRMRFDLVVNLLTARALSKGQITIFNGHQWRPFIHTHDIARAFVTCLEAPRELVSGQVFNAGDNRNNLTLKDLGEVVARVVPGTEVLHQENSSDRRSYRVDFSKIARTLGFQCLVSVERGVAVMADAIREGQFPRHEDVVYNNAALLKSAGNKAVEASPNGGGKVRLGGPNGHAPKSSSSLAGVALPQSV